VPRTLENTREIDETIVKPDDDEVFGDELDDEFAQYFANTKVFLHCITGQFIKS